MNHAKAYSQTAVVFAGLFALIGCGSGVRSTVRTTISTAGVAIVAVDDQNAAAMAATRQADLEASETQEQFRERRQPYWNVEAAVRSSVSTLEAAEHALDASGEDGLKAMAGCASLALGDLVTAVAALNDAVGTNISIPGPVDTLIELLDAYGSECNAN